MADIAGIVDSIRNRRPYRLRVILLCAAAATTFWFLNALNKQHTTTMNYPLQFLYDEQKYVEVETLPAEVVINVSGIGWNLLKNSMGIKITPLQIPLVNPQDQKKIAASALPSYISEQLSDFQLNYVLTDTLRINLDRRAEKYVHLSVDTSALVLGEMFMLGSPVTITPDSVLIRGPLQLVDNVSDTLLLNLGEEPITQTIEKKVQIQLEARNISVQLRQARVTLPVVELVTNSRIVPVTITGTDDTTYTTKPAELRVFYLVPSGREEGVMADDFKVEADLGSLDDDSTLLPSVVLWPEYVIKSKPDSIRVRLLKK